MSNNPNLNPNAIKPSATPYDSVRLQKTKMALERDRQERMKFLPDAIREAYAKEKKAKLELAQMDRQWRVSNNWGNGNGKDGDGNGNENEPHSTDVKNVASSTKDSKRFYPTAKQIAEFKAKDAEENERQAKQKALLEEAKKLPPKETKADWNRTLLLPDLLKHYQEYVGQVYHNPEFQLPPIISRADALKEVLDKQNKGNKDDMFRFGISHIVPMGDRLFLLGMQGNLSTVAIEVMHYRPRFWMSVLRMGLMKPKASSITNPALQPNLGEEIFPDAPGYIPRLRPTIPPKDLKDMLNQEQYWPKQYLQKHREFAQKQRYKSQYAKPSNYTPPLPIVDITVETLNISTKYSRYPDRPTYKIQFESMKAFKHYRKLLASGGVDGLGYKPRLYHEQETMVQMFMDDINYGYFDWVQMPLYKMRIAKESEWDEHAQMLRDYDAARAQNKAPEQDSWDNASYHSYRSKHQQDNTNNQHPSTRIWTKAHIEARVLFPDIQPLAKKEEREATMPLIVPYFDIETACHKQVQMQLQSKTLPPPIMDEEDVKQFKDGWYPQVKARMEQHEKEQQQKDKEKENPTTELFPRANNPKDGVIVYSTQITCGMDKDCFLKVLHCLGEVEFQAKDLPDTIVFTFDTEKDLLEHATGLLDTLRCTWYGGYNIIKYDLPYVYQRALMVNSPQTVRNLSFFLSTPFDSFRERTTRARPRKSKRFEKMSLIPLEMPGIYQMDLLPLVKSLNGNLSTYTLKSVAYHYAKDDKSPQKPAEVAKKDMPYQYISPYWAAGKVYYRRKLAIYCHQDVSVTRYVGNSANLLPYVIELARVALTNLDQQMFQGQQIKIMNMMLKRCRQQGRLLDEHARQEIQRFYGLDTQPVLGYLFEDLGDNDLKDFLTSSMEKLSLRRQEKAYQGATVLDPDKGFWRQFVTTADFASLYPSIMIAYLLCFSTWIASAYDKDNKLYIPIFDRVLERDPKTNQVVKVERATDQYVLWNPEFEDRPTDAVIGKRILIMTGIDPFKGVTCCFVQNRGSFLPAILQDLLALRKSVKKEMEKAELVGDILLAKVCDAKQAAIKVICNSAYGFTGARAGYFGCMPIAIATCMLGRQKIMLTKRMFEELGAKIIYGDTDSVFAVWEHLWNQSSKTFEEKMWEVRFICTMACNLVSDALPKPMKLEFEKLMYPYLLIGKKNYVGQWLWPKPKFFCKGTPNVRRDSCTIARETIEALFKAIMASPEDSNLIAKLEKIILDVCRVFSNKQMPLKHLIKTVAKRNEYSNPKLYQAQLFQKLKKRRGVDLDEGTRVPYVFALPQGGTRGRTNLKESVGNDAEDVDYMLKHNIPPNRSYYLNLQIYEPCKRFLVDTNLMPAAKVDVPFQKTLALIDSQDHRVTGLDQFLSVQGAQSITTAAKPGNGMGRMVPVTASLPPVPNPEEKSADNSAAGRQDQKPSGPKQPVAQLASIPADRLPTGSQPQNSLSISSNQPLSPNVKPSSLTPKTQQVSLEDWFRARSKQGKKQP